MVISRSSSSAVPADRAARARAAGPRPSGVAKLRLVERAAGDLELLLRVGRSRPAARSRERSAAIASRICAVLSHRRPIDAATRSRFAAEHAPSRDVGDDVDFAPRAFVPPRAAVAEADVVEHRLLRRRLRLFVAGQHRQDDRLARQAVGVAGVERGVEIDEHDRACRAPAAANVASGFEPYRLPPRQKPTFSSPSAAPSMQAIVSRPGVVGSSTPKWFCSRSKTASLSFGVTPTEPMPCTFEWPRIGISPAAGPADHAAQQGQVGDRLHVLHAVGVMRDAHRPTEDDVLGRGVALGDLVDLVAATRRSWR